MTSIANYPPGTPTSPTPCTLTIECDDCGNDYEVPGHEELGGAWADDDELPCPYCSGDEPMREQPKWDEADRQYDRMVDDALAQ